MKNPFSKQNVRFVAALKSSPQAIRVKSIIIIALLSGAVGLAPLFVLHAQQAKDQAVNVSSVSSSTSSSGTLVSIVADGSLSSAQTWRDGEGYHVVVPYASSQSPVKTVKGVKVRRVGKSLEILVQIRPGASVAVQRVDNRLNLSIGGTLGQATESEATEQRASGPDPTQFQQGGISSASFGSEGSDLAAGATPTSSNDQTVYQPNVPSSQSNASGTLIDSHQSAAHSNAAASSNAEDSGGAEIVIHEDHGLLASVFSSTGFLVVLALAIVGFLVYRRIRSHQAPKKAEESTVTSDELMEEESVDESGQSRQPGSGTPMPVATPGSLYGAYRIDREVNKLVLGQPHRMDVLSSRAPDDRRAIETFLVETIGSSPNETERRRACEALEEYGFVARQCAALLQAPEAYDRTSAARSLGAIKSPTALPFLLEALHDDETMVRSQAIVSIGELKLPSAIGALLDMARRYPNAPSTLLSRVLSSCSVEGVDYLDIATFQYGFDETFLDGTQDLQPVTPLEDLPDGSDDEVLEKVISGIQSLDIKGRSEAVKSLAQHCTRSSVSALTSLARLEPEGSVRAQAMLSLAAIDHESVFPGILIGMADESREVRAAAARSLSRLSFDRGAAYARLRETSDSDTLSEVAHACVKAGTLTQAIDRLANGNRRHAFEALSLISLLTKAKLTEPITEVLHVHPSIGVRIAVVRLLASTGEPEIFEQFRQLAVEDGMLKEVKTVLMETLSKWEHANAQAQPKEQEAGKTGEVDQDLRQAQEAESDLGESTPFSGNGDQVKDKDAFWRGKGPGASDNGGIPPELINRLGSQSAVEREAALTELTRFSGDVAFQYIRSALDDQAAPVRNAAARALYDIHPNRAASFTRVLRMGSPDQRRRFGAALASSGLASQAIDQLVGESRERTYDAFSLLFLMSKAGEVEPLMRAIEDHPNTLVRVAVVKLLALSCQTGIIAPFRRFTSRSSLPSEVRAAVTQALYQINSQIRVA